MTPPQRQRKAALVVVLMALALLPGFASAQPASRIVVLGLDGAEWSVVQQLWDEGQLPHLAALARAGVHSHLRTDHGSSSPVVWTTIATGLDPEDHGIHGFVDMGPDGPVPVSSRTRRAPALWNMAARSGLEVAVLGWWASWPAEAIDGLVVSDRLEPLGEGSVHPTERREWVRRAVRDLAPDGVLGAGPTTGDIGAWEQSRAQDRLVARLSSQVARGAPRDLLLSYLRSTDTAGHLHWARYARNGGAEGPDAVREAYRAADRLLGELVAASGSDANLFVVSDHGMRPSAREETIVQIDLDRLLAHLGFGAPDTGAARATALDGTTLPGTTRYVRLALPGRDDPAGVAPTLDLDAAHALRDRLRVALSQVRYDDGAPLLRVRMPRAREVWAGADLALEIQVDHPSAAVEVDGRVLSDVVTRISRVSGEHDGETHGIFLAAGPDIVGRGRVHELRIQDIAPTVLYGLGLPVGEDFAGHARTDLFTEDFRGRHPLRRIPTWGRREDHRPPTDDATRDDAGAIRRLRSLGYLAE